METQTLESAKQYLRDNYEKGCRCPACGQNVKLYPRLLSSSMAYALILIDKHTRDGKFRHIENHFKELDIPSSIRGDFAKLVYWGLIEKYQQQREDGSNRNGYYRITEKGSDFVKGKISVVDRMFVYNQQIQGYGKDEITIFDALRNKFDYNDLMGS